MNYSKLDDPTLIDLVTRAHADALAELYDRYGSLVFSIALRMVGDRATAEDITLDVFTRVWERARLYQAGRASVSTWLASMARHRAIDVLRRTGTHPTPVSLDAGEDVGETNADGPTPEEMTELSLRQQHIRAAMAQLPEEQRAVLELAYFGGLSHREIVEQLGEPLGTVKTRLRLAMQKLRVILQDEQ